MYFFDTFTLIVRIQAIFLMLVVAFKLYYVDRTQQKTKLALTFERFMKYSLFKQALLFIFLTFLFGTAADVLSMRGADLFWVRAFSVLSLLGLLSFAYMLFKISSYTYERHNGILKTVVSSSDVIVPLVGGGITALLVFMLPFGASPTGMVIAGAGRSSAVELILLLLVLGSVGLIVARTVRK